MKKGFVLDDLIAVVMALSLFLMILWIGSLIFRACSQ